jgi:hypothetical protein
MVKVIVGGKGSGKTARLVDDLNAQAFNDSNNVVCIQYGHRLDRLVKYKIRLVDIMEYPVKGYRELLSFIAGISAKDYDLTHVYVDSVYKVSGSRDPAELEAFLKDLDEFADRNSLHVTIIISADPDELSEGIKAYC